MDSVAIYSPIRLLRLGIINIFIFIGLLRLTNFNFYLSQALGLEVEINNTGGNAFNFINYIGVALLGLILFTKIKTITARWKSGWPIYVLMSIYLINGFVSPYANHTWLIYQELFLSIALILHLYIQKVPDDFINRFVKATRPIFWASIALVFFSFLMIINFNSLSYYFAEYNEVFVQTLDDFGIMKQRFGYLLGFLASYIFFILKGHRKKMLLLLLILFVGFGTRSFVIGLLGATSLFTIKRFRYLLLMLTTLIVVGYLFLPYVTSIVYDTRFYSFVNAFNIINEFPFGVGLGGYPIYTEEYHRQLYASFYDINAVLDYIPLAPESDLVHLFGSLGLLLGGLHLALQIRIVTYTYILQDMMNSFEKCILFYFCFMTFFGISEDSIFSINYWIFFGISSGIISSLIYKRKNDVKPYS